MNTISRRSLSFKNMQKAPMPRGETVFITNDTPDESNMLILLRSLGRVICLFVFGIEVVRLAGTEN